MKIIDLSHPLNNHTPTYPGDPNTVINEITSFKQDGYLTTQFSTSLHNGTHVDAPCHLSENKKHIDDYSLDTFIGTPSIIKITDPIIDLTENIKQIISDSKIVIFQTNYDTYYGTEIYYRNHPTITLSLANYLISAGVRIVGFDSPSPDREPFEVHQYLLDHDVLIVENLTNLTSLEDYNKIIIHMVPLKIHAEASLIRAYAIVDDVKPF
ncbi:MAG: cyclase family protein [Erysipelothrix sp.]